MANLACRAIEKFDVHQKNANQRKSAHHIQRLNAFTGGHGAGGFDDHRFRVCLHSPGQLLVAVFWHTLRNQHGHICAQIISRLLAFMR